MFAEYELIIPSFSSFSIRAAVAGEERKTWLAKTLSGVLAFFCSRVISLRSIASI